ncbi:hypothetical protein HK101_004490 [Irineochytrium annulatum]|nr:hypothetical protein HK101_004490 [Irineochytrium annulatum]
MEAGSAEALEILHQMSQLLDVGLDKETLALCVSLCEQGVNPEAVSAVVKELKREAAGIQARKAVQTQAKD